MIFITAAAFLCVCERGGVELYDKSESTFMVVPPMEIFQPVQYIQMFILCTKPAMTRVHGRLVRTGCLQSAPHAQP